MADISIQYGRRTGEAIIIPPSTGPVTVTVMRARDGATLLRCSGPGCRAMKAEAAEEIERALKSAKESAS